MAPVGSSESPRKHWRPDDTPESARTQRWVGRVVTTLLLLVLTGVLLWIIWPRAQQVHFVALTVVDYDPLVLPPIAFWEEDVQAFASVAPGGAFHDFRELQTSESMPLLRTRLGGILQSRRWWRRGDGLILYISAHGVADRGVPYLLCSDYHRPGVADGDGAAGRYPLGELLRQIAACEAAWKLVLLDTGQHIVDPRSGLPANEFPRLLEQEVRSINDPTLWVLTANRPLQMSHVSYAAGRSMFGHYVTEGLRGAADGNRDRAVSLAELDYFVRNGVAAWVRWDVGTPAAQVPWLLHADEGRGMDKIKLAFVPRRTAPEVDSAGEESTGQESAEADGDDPSGKATVPEEADVAAGLPARAQWEHRDRLRDLTPPRKWAPIDTEPHLWNRSEDTLVEYERRRRFGTVDREVASDDLALARLPAYRHPNSLEEDASVEFPGRMEYEPLKRVIQHKNALMSRLPGYVRYRAHAVAMTGEGRGPAYDELAKAIDQLRRLVEEVERFERREPLDPADSTTRQTIDRLAGEAERLAATEREFRNRLNDDGRELASRPADEGAAARIPALLHTLLLDTEVRAALVAALKSLDAKPPDISQLPRGFDEDPDGLVREFTARQWRLLDQQAQLEYRLAQLAKPAGEVESPGELAGHDAEEQWAAYRRFAEQMERFYAGLPAEINERLASSDEPVRWSAGRLLRLVRPGEAGRIRGNFRAATCVFPVLPPREPWIELAVEPSGPLRLEAGQPMEWNLDVTTSGFTPQRAEYRIEFDPKVIDLRNVDTGDRVEPDTPVTFALGSGRTRLPLTATALKAAPPGKDDSRVKVVVRVQASAAADPKLYTGQFDVPFVRPTPDQIDLLVHRIDHEGTTLMKPWAGSGALRLHAFPNRPTRFHFYLANRSHRRREVEVELLAVPEQWADRQLAEPAVLDEFGKLRPGVRRVAGPVVVELPDDDREVPVDFSPPAQEPGNGATAPEGGGPGAGANNASEAAEPEGPDVTAGLVCLIRRPESSRPDWIYFLRFDPMMPVEYVVPRVSYDGKGRLAVHVEPRRGWPLPPLDEMPIRILWPRDRRGGALEGKYEAEIAKPNSDGTLYARVPTGSTDVIEIPLEIDKYPRAFVYRVRCDGPQQQKIDPERNLRRVWIERPKSNAVYRVPLEEPIRFGFAVDAPADAFHHPDDRVEVHIVEEHGKSAGPEKTFFSARQKRIELRKAEGAVEVFARVSDFEVPLDSRLENMRVRLVAQLSLPRRGHRERDEVSIALDGRPPEIRGVHARSPAPQGRPIEVRVQAEDPVGGIERIQLGFEGQDGDFAPAPEPVEMELIAGDSRSGQWSAQLPTAEVPVGAHRLLVRAVDAAGNPPTMRRQPLHITQPPPPPKPTDPPPKIGTIEVRVIDGRGNPLGGTPIRVLELNREGSSDGKGHCTFTGVPHGKYTITGRKPLRGRMLEGEATAELSPGNDPAIVHLRLD